MYLFLVGRFGNDLSAAGPNADDTVFLVRARDHEEAAKLVDPRLDQMPHELAEPFSQFVAELAHDTGDAAMPQVLVGPAIGFWSGDYPRQWARNSRDGVWTQMTDDDVFSRATLQTLAGVAAVEIAVPVARELLRELEQSKLVGKADIKSQQESHYILTMFYRAGGGALTSYVNVLGDRLIIQQGEYRWERDGGEHFRKLADAIAPKRQA